MAKILVFDSGVGGLSILQAIQSHKDIDAFAHQWLFCSDNEFFPYGTKSEIELIDRVRRVLRAVAEQYQPDIIVIACNTASTVALDAVRAELSVPIIGVVPAIKPAALLSKTRSIGLLATPGTIKRNYTQQLITDFASDCHITLLGSTDLVEMAEDFLRTGRMDKQQLADILAPLSEAIRNHQLDSVVLACTHFPLLIDALKDVLPEVSYWVDSGDAIARRVIWCLNTLPDKKIPVEDDAQNGCIAFFTRHDETAEALGNTLVRFRLKRIAQLNLR
jgi:glutamate racemase